MSEKASLLGRIDINLLYTFAQVVDSGGVGSAAATLGRTQPAITARLRALERDLGVSLLERVGRGTRPTAAGRAVHAEFQRLLVSLGGIVDRLQTLKTEPYGVLRIGALPTVSAYLLSPVLARLQAVYPRMLFHIQPKLAVEQRDQLRRGDLDVVISIGDVPLDDGVIEYQTVAHAQARAACRMERGRRRPRMSAAEVRAEGLIAYGAVGDPFFDAVWQFIERSQLTDAIRITVPHILSIQRLVLSGAGVGILPDYTIAAEGLAARPVEGLRVSQPIFVAMRKSHRASPLVRSLVSELKRSFKASSKTRPGLSAPRSADRA